MKAQIRDVSIPASMNPSVRDAMQYVVNRSGYTLCGPEQGHVNILYTRPLPAAQYKLGPMSLRNTLQVLAGPAWQVKVDEVMRSVCFVLRPGYQLPDAPRLAALPARTPTPAPTAETATPSAAAASTPLLVQSTQAKASTAAAPTIGRASSPRPTTEHHRATPAKDGLSTHRPRTVSVASTTALQRPAAAGQAAPGHSATKALATAQRPATPSLASAPATPYGVPSVRLNEPASAMGETLDATVGSTLKQSVDAWAKHAGWQAIWRVADSDYI